MQKIMNIEHAKKLASKYWNVKQATLNKDGATIIFRKNNECILCAPNNCNKCIYVITKRLSKDTYYYCVKFPLESTYDKIYLPSHTTTKACRKRAIIIYLYILLSYIHNGIYYMIKPFQK